MCPGWARRSEVRAPAIAIPRANFAGHRGVLTMSPALASIDQAPSSFLGLSNARVRDRSAHLPKPTNPTIDTPHMAQEPQSYNAPPISDVSHNTSQMA